jgi:hypothetical protein
VRASSVITWVRAAWVIQVLLPVIPVVAAVLHGAGAQAAKVGAGVGLGEDGRGQDLAAGETAATSASAPRCRRKDQLGRDLGPGAERADADIAARQLFRDDAHGRLGQAEAAEFLGDGQAEDAHFGQFLDDLHRDQLVLEVPFMRMGLTLSTEKRRNCSRIISSSSSRPLSPHGDLGRPSCISSTRRVRAACVLPDPGQRHDLGVINPR